FVMQRHQHHKFQIIFADQAAVALDKGAGVFVTEVWGFRHEVCGLRRRRALLHFLTHLFSPCSSRFMRACASCARILDMVFSARCPGMSIAVWSPAFPR